MPSGFQVRQSRLGVSAADRLMIRVARMYHERGISQTAIAGELHISQARVSRLLKKAVATGVVRTVVAVPIGSHVELEERLERDYGLDEVLVVETSGAEEDLVRPLGQALAGYLETTLKPGERVGISSWSSILLAAAEALRPFPVRVVERVVQLMGGAGSP